jgi:hypothetical protein
LLLSLAEEHMMIDGWLMMLTLLIIFLLVNPSKIKLPNLFASFFF